MNMEKLCKYQDRCIEFEKKSLDEQQCCGELFYECFIYSKYLEEDTALALNTYSEENGLNDLQLLP